MVLWSSRGEDLLRAGRRRSESERVGGGGGRLHLRREMLRVEQQEEEEREHTEEALLCFLRPRPADGEPPRFSERTEGVARPGDSGGSQGQNSPEAQSRSWSAVVQSLWRLELGERDL